MARLRALTATVAVFVGASAANSASLLYYNDGGGGISTGAGVVASPVETFGHVIPELAYQDDPLLAGLGVSNSNKSYVFQHDKEAGKRGGGVYLRFDLTSVPGGVSSGAIVGVTGNDPNDPGDPGDPDPPAVKPETYGTVAQSDDPPGSLWKANFAWANGEEVSGPVSADRRFKRLVEEARAGERPLNNLKYIVNKDGTPTGAPTIFQSEIQPDDPAPGELESALQGADGMIFFEVPDGTLDYLDLFIGDFEQDVAWDKLNHHLTFFALLGDTGPADFGIDPADANLFLFPRTGNEDSSGIFRVDAAVAFEDPVIPLPAPVFLLATACAALFAVRRRKAG